MEGSKNTWIVALIASVFVIGGLGMGGYGMMGFGMGFGFLAMLLIGGVLVWLVVSLAGASGRDDALAILKRRYASGEISKKQYDAMRKDVAP